MLLVAFQLNDDKLVEKCDEHEKLQLNELELYSLNLHVTLYMSVKNILYKVPYGTKHCMSRTLLHLTLLVPLVVGVWITEGF